MTILEKQGPSTASVSGSSQGEDHHIGQEYCSEKGEYESAGSGPPSYADSIPTGPTSTCASSSRPSGLPPSNHVFINKANDKIYGHWNVDTNLTVPEPLLRPLASGQFERPNLYLHTRNGSIQPTISLVSGSAQRANLEFETWNGKVVVTVVSRANSQPFKLKATTRNGEVIISLPFDFVGPLRYHTRNGKVKFSESLQAITSTFSDGSSFVGDWQAAGFVDRARWEGDEVEVETANGKIQFTYSDDHSREPRKESRTSPTASESKLKKGGFFGRH